MPTLSNQFRLCALLGLGLVLSLDPALAQSGGGGSSGGSSSGGASSGGAAGGAGAASPGAGGSGSDAAGARSRAARQPGASTPGGAAARMAPNPALNPNPALPGQSAVPSPNPGGNQAATPGRATGQGDLNSPQQGQVGARSTNRGGTPDPTPNNQVQPNSPSDRSQAGQQQGGVTTGGTARREGAAGHDMQSCMGAWDSGTHMTKAQWRRVCSNTLSDRRSIIR